MSVREGRREGSDACGLEGMFWVIGGTTVTAGIEKKDYSTVMMALWSHCGSLLSKDSRADEQIVIALDKVGSIKSQHPVIHHEA